VAVTKKAFTIKVQEAQVLQYRAALQELTNHLQAHGYNTTAMKGSTSSFLEKVRLMQTSAHRQWRANYNNDDEEGSKKTLRKRFVKWALTQGTAHCCGCLQVQQVSFHSSSVNILVHN